jgi:hypothetical protein
MVHNAKDRNFAHFAQLKKLQRASLGLPEGRNKKKTGVAAYIHEPIFRFPSNIVPKAAKGVAMATRLVPACWSSHL